MFYNWTSPGPAQPSSSEIDGADHLKARIMAREQSLASSPNTHGGVNTSPGVLSVIWPFSTMDTEPEIPVVPHVANGINPPVIIMPTIAPSAVPHTMDDTEQPDVSHVGWFGLPSTPTIKNQQPSAIAVPTPPTTVIDTPMKTTLPTWNIPAQDPLHTTPAPVSMTFTSPPAFPQVIYLDGDVVSSEPAPSPFKSPSSSFVRPRVVVPEFSFPTPPPTPHVDTEAATHSPASPELMTFDGAPDITWSVSKGPASSTNVPSPLPLQVPTSTLTLATDDAISPLSYIWPFGPGAEAPRGTDDVAVLKQQLLAVTQERDELLANQQYRRDTFSQTNPLAASQSGKRLKDLESKAKLDGEMVSQLEAEKGYLADALRVAQGLVESSHELTRQKQGRIDELERAAESSARRDSGELRGATALLDSARLEMRHLEDLVAAKQQRIEELEQGQVSAEVSHQERLSGAKDLADSAEREIQTLRDRLAMLESGLATVNSGAVGGDDGGGGGDGSRERVGEEEQGREHEVQLQVELQAPLEVLNREAVVENRRLVEMNNALRERVMTLEKDAAADKKKIAGLLAQLRTAASQKCCGKACCVP